jgi:hypothetical protein
MDATRSQRYLAENWLSIRRRPTPTGTIFVRETAAMVKRFRRKRRRSRHRRVNGQWWQIESGFSRNKRLMGSALWARRWPNQRREVLMRVLTHNLMLVAAA